MPPAGDIPPSLAIATHYYASGPAFDLEAYARSRTRRLLFIAHPLYSGGGPSYFRRYEEGRLVQTLEVPATHPAVRFLSDVARTTRWVQVAGPYDIFLAGDNLLAMAGLWLRRTHRIRRLLLYSIDYVPDRFRNPILNFAYHRVDRLAARRSDVVWNLSAAIEAARRDRDGRGRTAPQIVVPLGTNVTQIRRLPLSQASAERLAFLGHVLEKQGLQLVIEAMSLVRQHVPGVSLLVLGDGPFLPTVRTLALTTGVKELVEFAGYVEDHREIEQRLAGCALGLATYVPDPRSFSRFADPGKIKTYLACGLPVIMTDVPPVARLVQQRGAGRIVPYDASALSDAIVGYLTDAERLQSARASAAELGAEYDWERVLDTAFHASAPYLR